MGKINSKKLDRSFLHVDSEAPRLQGGASLYFEGLCPSNSLKTNLFLIGVLKGLSPFNNLRKISRSFIPA